MGGISIWHWIVVIVIFFFFIPIFLSPVIWFATKDPNNKTLKVIYWMRFIGGLLTILSLGLLLIPDNSMSGASATDLAITILTRLVIGVLMMMRWSRFMSKTK